MTPMRVVSVNVGVPRTISWRGQPVQTGIFKEAVAGRQRVRRLNLDGDRQADLSVHGGLDKAVYAYPIEHYDFWRLFLDEDDLPPGAFGENLTLEGLTEETVHVGDHFRIGTVELTVTQPRTPCYKLAAKFGRTDIVRRFLESGYSGFYLSVQQEGELGPEDTVHAVEREMQQIRVADLNRIQRGEAIDVRLLRKAVQIKALPQEWRNAIQEGLR